ncbi:MAG: hypothetical protein M5R42_09605 [Rhodocyclaceae bacterium]|nr:hypothetical protein [Rhodocyclaceae bacterium]
MTPACRTTPESQVALEITPVRTSCLALVSPARGRSRQESQRRTARLTELT